MDNKNTTYTYAPELNNIYEAREDMADLGKTLGDRANQSVGRDFMYSLSSLALVNPLAAGAVVGAGAVAAGIYGIATSTAVRAMRCRRRLHSLYSKTSSHSGYGTGGMDFLHGAFSNKRTALNGSGAIKMSTPTALGPSPLTKTTENNIEVLNKEASRFVNAHKNIKIGSDAYNDSISDGMNILQNADSNYYGVNKLHGGGGDDDLTLARLYRKKYGQGSNISKEEESKINSQINDILSKKGGSLTDKNKKLEPIRKKYADMLDRIDKTGKSILNNFDVKNKRGLDAGRNKVVVASDKLKAQWETLFDKLKTQAADDMQKVIKSGLYQEYVRNIEFITAYLSEENPQDSVVDIAEGYLYTYTNTKGKLRMFEIVKFDAATGMYVIRMVNNSVEKSIKAETIKKMRARRVVVDDMQKQTTAIKGGTYKIINSNYVDMYVVVVSVKTVNIDGKSTNVVYFRYINDLSNTIYSKYVYDFNNFMSPRLIRPFELNDSYQEDSAESLNEADGNDTQLVDVEAELKNNTYVYKGTFKLMKKEGSPIVVTGDPTYGKVVLESGDSVSTDDWSLYQAIEIPTEEEDEDAVIDDIAKVHDIDPNKAPLTYKEFHDMYYKNIIFSKFVNDVMLKHASELAEYSITKVGDKYTYNKKGGVGYNPKKALSDIKQFGLYIDSLGDKVLIKTVDENLKDKNESVSMSYNIFYVLNEESGSSNLASALSKKINNGIKQYCEKKGIKLEDLVNNPKKYDKLLKGVDKLALDQILQIAKETIEKSEKSKEDKEAAIKKLSEVVVSYVKEPKNMGDSFVDIDGKPVKHKNYRTSDVPDTQAIADSIWNIVTPAKSTDTEKKDDEKETKDSSAGVADAKSNVDGFDKNVKMDDVTPEDKPVVADDEDDDENSLPDDISNNVEDVADVDTEQQDLPIIKTVCLEIKKEADATLTELVKVVGKKAKLKVGGVYTINKADAEKYISGLSVKESINEEIGKNDDTIDVKVVSSDDNKTVLEIEDKLYTLDKDVVNKLNFEIKIDGEQADEVKELVSPGIKPIDIRSIEFIRAGIDKKLTNIVQKYSTDEQLRGVVDSVLNANKSELMKYGVTNIEEFVKMVGDISKGYPKYEIGKKYTISYKKEEKLEKLVVDVTKEDGEFLYLKTDKDEFRIKKNDWLTYDPVLYSTESNESVKNIIYSLYKTNINENYVVSVSNIKDVTDLLSIITKQIEDGLNKLNSQNVDAKKQEQGEDKQPNQQQPNQPNQQQPNQQQPNQPNQQQPNQQQPNQPNQQQPNKQEIDNAKIVNPTTSVSSGIVVKYTRDCEINESIDGKTYCIVGCACGDYNNVNSLYDVVDKIKQCSTVYELGKLIKENENFMVCSVDGGKLDVAVPIRNAITPFKSYEPVYEKLVVVSADIYGNVLNVHDNKILKLMN